MEVLTPPPDPSTRATMAKIRSRMRNRFFITLSSLIYEGSDHRESHMELYGLLAQE